MKFIRGTVKTIVEIRPGQVRQFTGGYDYYMERITAEQNAAAADKNANAENRPEPADSKKDQRRERARKRQEMSQEKRRLERETSELEKFITDAEAEKAKLMEQWMVPGQDFDFAANQKRLAELEIDIASATEKWEKSAAALEELMVQYNAIHDN